MMRYDEFLGQVRSRAQLASKDEAIKATRATLEVLGERLFGGEAQDLAAQLPAEMAAYLRQEKNEAFGLEEFLKRIGEREGSDRAAAETHARAVISVLSEAVSPGEIEDIRSQLPGDYRALFEKEGKTLH